MSDTALALSAIPGVPVPSVPGWEVVQIPPISPAEPLPAAVAEQAARATVVLSDVAPADSDAMTSLRWWQLGSAGYTQLAGHRFPERGVRVSNASGVNDIPIAEWCLLMMLSLERDLPAILAQSDRREYQRPQLFQSELRGRRVGIVGYGGIGREVARLATAFGLDVSVMNRSPIGPAPLRFAPAGTGDPDGTLEVHRYPMGDWAPFLADLDYLVLTVALNSATRSLIGAAQLKLLPRTAFLLNPARGALVDERALTDALESGELAGAALDSHYREPLQPDDATWSLPRTIITPHVSGSTGSPQYLPRVGELFASNLARFRDGRPLLNQVPPGDLPN